MANSSNSTQEKKWFIYYRDMHEPIQVSKEIHDAYYKEPDRIRRTEQNNGRCACTKRFFSVCDGDCLVCEHHIAGETASLDATNPDGSGAFDNLPDISKPIDEIIADRSLVNQLFDRLRELDPDADTIIQLWIDHPEGISDKAIAEKLGRSQQAFSYQMKKYRSVLKELLLE